MALPIRDDEPTRRVPWITLTLIALNVFVFLFLQPSAFQGGGIDRPESQGRYWRAQEQEDFLYRWGTVACEVTTGETLASRPEGCHDRKDQPDQPPQGKSIALALLTAMFLHGSIDHLAGNMLFLWVFGSAVEDRLGRLNYLGLYLLGGMVATLGYVALNSTSPVPLLGASGAIAVAMGAYLVLLPRGRILTIVATAAFQVVYVPAVVVLLLFFVTQFITDPSENIATEAHAAGMIVGFLATLVLARIPAVRQRRREESADAELRAGAAF
ncbi:MAG: putative rane protein [Ilumatobacteraceae bacterium]|nr:putative rane protein [Ilumatobacteraceae bacterium]